MKILQEKNRRNAMDYSSLILMERDNETGFVSKEVGSFQVSEGAEFVKNFYVKGDTVYFIFDTKEDVEEWQYSAIYDLSLNPVKPVSADIIEADTYENFLREQSVLFFGNGAAKCRSVLTNPKALFLDKDINPLASDMLALAEKAFRERDFKDVAYFEPFYLKEFVATKPKHKVL